MSQESEASDQHHLSEDSCEPQDLVAETAAATTSCCPLQAMLDVHCNKTEEHWHWVSTTQAKALRASLLAHPDLDPRVEQLEQTVAQLTGQLVAQAAKLEAQSIRIAQLEAEAAAKKTPLPSPRLTPRKFNTEPQTSMDGLQPVSSQFNPEMRHFELLEKMVKSRIQQKETARVHHKLARTLVAEADQTEAPAHAYLLEFSASDAAKKKAEVQDACMLKALVRTKAVEDRRMQASDERARRAAATKARTGKAHAERKSALDQRREAIDKARDQKALADMQIANEKMTIAAKRRAGNE